MWSHRADGASPRPVDPLPLLSSGLAEPYSPQQLQRGQFPPKSTALQSIDRAPRTHLGSSLGHGDYKKWACLLEACGDLLEKSASARPIHLLCVKSKVIFYLDEGRGVHSQWRGGTRSDPYITRFLSSQTSSDPRKESQNGASQSFLAGELRPEAILSPSD